MVTPHKYIRRNGYIQAIRFPKDPTRAHEVTDWLDGHGFPWLIGDALNPDSLRYSQNPDDTEKPRDGIYIDPTTGNLVLRCMNEDMMVYPGDYIIVARVDVLYPMRGEDFENMYDTFIIDHLAGDVDTNDPVEHPSHYTRGSIEVIDFIEDQKLGYHQGNAIKYICRAGFKDPSKFKEDIRKAIFYLNRLL